jgi:cell division protein ZapE
MVEVHRRIRALPQTADTLAVIARDFAGELRLLVLDEFFVADIADAMILGRLFEQLVERGVTVVATSNTPPRELYRDGLQRARFLPAIEAIERHCRVHCLDGPTDHRLRTLTRAATYWTPADAASEARLAEVFAGLAPESPPVAQELLVNERPIRARALAEGVAWFGFAELCDGPRSAADYVEIARDFNTVLLSGVPLFERGNDAAGRRFIFLVDELYDRNVNLVLSAAADALSLCRNEDIAAAFERTTSRLVEMQTGAYLAREHRP